MPWATRLPDGSSWTYTDWVAGDEMEINPAIIHNMRGKHLMTERAPISEPVGSMLHAILAECGIKPPTCPECEAWRQTMDEGGIEYARVQRRAIIKRLKDASANVGWLQMAKVAARGFLTVEQILDAAIVRTKAHAEKPNTARAN